jgi:5-methyltetrahydrofolate--homocysteine methyltransferase
MSHNHLPSLLNQRILILDGAMGTSLQTMDLTAEDFGGEDLLGCNEFLVISKPEAITAVHNSYLEAGADIIETNTFGGTPVVLAEYNLQDRTTEINLAAAKLARACCDAYSTPEKPRFVAGAMGPTTKSLAVTGGITFDDMAAGYTQQAVALIEGGVDYLLLETALDTLNLKAGYIGCLDAFTQTGKTLPIAISGTIETMGTMLAGQGVEALYTSVEHMNLLYIGLNCATGPSFMKDHIRGLAAIARCPIAVAPNAGIPDGDGNYPEGPKALADVLISFAEEGWINMLGGCCGTTPKHIAELATRSKNIPPRQTLPPMTSRASGIDPITFENDSRPYIVGERTNVIGSRAFKTMITDERFEEAAEIARKQVKAGAHVIDVCLSNPDRDEVSDVTTFLNFATKLVKVPLMIDSQMPDVVEAAFKLTQGKCLLNSVNLEDHGKACKTLLPLVKKYGAAVVVGCIDEEMAVTAQEKLAVAKKAHAIITQDYGIPEEDIIFDPLVFPCGTGDEKYFGSGKETIEGVRLIKEFFPRCKTVLGISNISFGLPGAGREVLNSVFLYHCTKAGLDMAIVNSEKLERYSHIPDEEKALCDDLLWYNTANGNDPVANFAAHFRDKKTVEKAVVDLSSLPVEKRLEINIVEGTKENLIPNLDDALKQWDPLGVINGPLMAAMDIVGRLFNNNELIVAEVLQSAEVMKAAVAHLESFMEKGDINVRGKMLLATVKGDVHDIGKNLVQIILGNNGYHVIDLGIKCPPETLIAAYKEHAPDLIGLSGLLVKSAQQMVTTAQDLTAAGISIPILVGGAALSEQFTITRIASEYQGPVLYCRDAMTGLAVANQLTDSSKREAFIAAQAQHQADFQTSAQPGQRGSSKREHKEKLVFDHSSISIKTPSFETQVLEGDLSRIWSYINPQMLYGNHLGLKGNVKSLFEKKDPKLLKLIELMDSLKTRIINEKLLTAKAVYRFLKVKAEGDAIHILDPKSEKTLETFTFPRQSDGLGLCLSDFLNPNAIDTICAFVVTCGDGVAHIAKELMEKGEYFNSHALSALALESAEGFAEYLHTHIRSEWGIPDPEGLSLDDIFKLKYTGVRVSFGYPACPRLEDQEKLFKLLDPEKHIGVTLSEEYMMSPEASVSALVFHHPQARYFTISEADLAGFESGS